MKTFLAVSSFTLFSIFAQAQVLPISVLNEVRDLTRLKFNSNSVVVESIKNFETLVLGDDLAVQAEVTLLDASTDSQKNLLCSYLYVSQKGRSQLTSVDCQ